MGLCPFLDDHEPSLVISPEKNLWHCLGACNEGGDVITWVMKRQGVSFRHAVELLREGDAALSVPAEPVKRSTTTKHPTPLAANPDDQKQLAIVIDYYHEALKQGPEALDYLKRADGRSGHPSQYYVASKQIWLSRSPSTVRSPSTAWRL